jgi:pimeloyl-ACP methyl ester carboxylesterase
MPVCTRAEPPPLIVRLDDGRQLGYARYGEKGKNLLFYFHGLPGSRLECRLIDPVATAHGIEVIAVDRPGYGYSALQAGASLLDWVQDIRSLADTLEIQHFSVMGVSGGAPCALACAAALSDRIDSVVLVSSLGPVYLDELRRHLPWFARLAFNLPTHSPVLFDSLLGRPLAWLACTHPRRLLQLVGVLNGGEDLRLLQQPAIRDSFALGLPACFQQGSAGARRDLTLYREPWHIEFGQIRQPVSIWCGDQDRIVPASHSQYLHDHIPHSCLRQLPGEGHFSLPINHIQTILASLYP